MRKVTEKTALALFRGESRTVGNTHTDGTRLYLHGNLIAVRGKGFIKLSLAGWNTPTTRERLNGILDIFGVRARFYQKNHIAFFQYGDEKPIEIDDLEKFFKIPSIYC
jgi:hypothetical protein